MKKIFCLLFGMILSIGWNIQASIIPSVTEYVEDYANILQTEDLNELRKKAHSIDEKYHTQIVTVILPSTQEQDIADLSIELFNAIGIGHTSYNRGVLLLIALQEKQIRTAVGYGLEGNLPDLLTHKLVEESGLSRIFSGDSGGLFQWYQSLEHIIQVEGNLNNHMIGEELLGQGELYVALGGILLVVLGMGIIDIMRLAKRRNYGLRSHQTRLQRQYILSILEYPRFLFLMQIMVSVLIIALIVYIQFFILDQYHMIMGFHLDYQTLWMIGGACGMFVWFGVIVKPNIGKQSKPIYGGGRTGGGGSTNHF